MQITTLRDERHQVAAVAAAVPRRRLLCATDLTARSEHAVRRTGLLARQIGADAHFVHAVDDGGSGRVVRMKVNRAFARLLSESERAMRRAPNEATAAVRLGKPLEAIAAAVRDWSPDLIVMATPRRRCLDPVIGTTAERVIRSTGRSVLLVNGIAERPYERVVLATDASSTSSQVARSMLELGILDNAFACVVHAFEFPYRYASMPANFTYVNGAIRQDEWDCTIRRDVLRSLQVAGADLARVHVSIEQARPLEAIRRAIDRVNPELLVIGVGQWLALKRVLASSVADQVFRNVSCDILAISPHALLDPFEGT